MKSCAASSRESRPERVRPGRPSGGAWPSWPGILLRQERCRDEGLPFMSDEIRVSFEMNREDVKKKLDAVLDLAKFVAKFTPTDADDNIIAKIEGVVSNPWFVDLLTFFLSQVDPAKAVADFFAIAKK
jgi:exosome complex RNA-binding protein Rrp4